ncbi:HD domain-containing protein [Serpentinicella alkaliphila]|uniref:HD/PDEase domain-containing protein n=1 Tax=Serpentinicella alkaliphila TaxID=1734049 RepID=A0A4R2TAY9_9FIRM|nr:HD domain-containing protein [Serpentinicella alkaliphila]QUH26566.1 HD domain-containing protein [Serpentinicella alkaliphila]TCP99051.1 uncharacterized protein EDD79_103714 [Serpentinicella alkaliphila]
MNKEMKAKLIRIAKQNIQKDSSSNEINHAIRVLIKAEFIAKKEGGDLDVIVPSALFHDIFWYPKGHSKFNYGPYESAGFAVKVLNKINGYPHEKIPKVYSTIKQCSLNKSIKPDSIEAKILRDADRLDVTGSISLTRTISSMDQADCKVFNFDKGTIERLDKKLDFKIDVLYSSIVKITDLMHTTTGKTLAEKRTNILKKYMIYMN